MYNHLVENDLREDASKQKYSKGNLSAEDLSAKVYKTTVILSFSLLIRGALLWYKAMNNITRAL
jgi:hypothetical protein